MTSVHSEPSPLHDPALRPRRARAFASAAALVAAAGTLVWALASVVVGSVALVTQLAGGTIAPTMHWRAMTFEDDGSGHSGVRIAGAGGGVVTSVTGASAGTVALYVAATLLGMATQVALAILARRLLIRVRAGRPFERSASREVALLGGVLLTCGVAAQVLQWLTQVAVLADAGGSSTLTPVFAFEPLTVTAGLALLLIAAAFRTGERLERDTAGLV